MLFVHAEGKLFSPKMLLKHSCFLPQMGQYYYL